MITLACVLLLVGVTTSQDACVGASSSCEQVWLTAGEGVTDPVGLCDVAKTYRTCLEDATKTQEPCPEEVLPPQLEMETAIYCNMPADIGRLETPCSAAQRQCQAQWSAGRAGKTRAEQHCQLAQSWLACVQAAVANYLCVDFGQYAGYLDMELQVNCVGGTSECTLKQKTCQYRFRRARRKAGSNRGEVCTAARKWRECLVETVRSGLCVESVNFPWNLDRCEADYCDDHTPKPPCSVLAGACRRRWQQATDSLTSLPHRCDHAHRWVACLEQIIQGGGCPGGYTVDVDAQVERAMSCHVAFDPDLDECGRETSRCWKRYQVQRKYSPNDEGLCDNVLQARQCIEGLAHAKTCPADTHQPDELGLAEVDFCKARYERQCTETTGACRDTFIKTTYSTSLPSTICKASREWRLCIRRATTKVCTPIFPKELENAEQQCLIPDPSTAPPLSECDRQMNACRYQHQTSTISDVCQRSSRWRRCLDDLRSSCHVIYPMELNDIQSKNVCNVG